MGVFTNLSDIKHSWTCLSDISREQLEQWNDSFAASGISPATHQLIVRVPLEIAKQKVTDHSTFISQTNEVIRSLHEQLCTPHFFILTDADGMMLDAVSFNSALQLLENINIGLGTLFALDCGGINAISMAMLLHSTVVLKGTEHTLDLFKDWTCICFPIKNGESVVGYLDLSFKSDIEVTFAVPLLERAIREIEKKLQNLNPEIKQKKIIELFDAYSLSIREKEVGYRWLQNQSALQIATSMGITEGTVRNMLKKVYAKTGICDKGQFIRKFIV